MAYTPEQKDYLMSDKTEAPEDFLRVGAGSSPQAVAAAIAHAIYETRRVTLRAVGAGAVNQAVKSIAIARGFTAPRGLDLTCKPGFASIESHDGTISAIVFVVEAN
jgi:stage V sporulation protein S